MHPTLTAPTLGPVVPTDEQISARREYLLHVGLRAESRHLFTEGWLTGAVRDLAGITIIDAITIEYARGILSRALAVIAAVEQLDSEDNTLHTTGRDDPETGEALPAGVSGFSLGRSAR